MKEDRAQDSNPQKSTTQKMGWRPVSFMSTDIAAIGKLRKKCTKNPLTFPKVSGSTDSVRAVDTWKSHNDSEIQRVRQGQHHFLDQSSEADASLSDNMNLARLSISSVTFHKQYSVLKFHIVSQDKQDVQNSKRMEPDWGGVWELPSKISHLAH